MSTGRYPWTEATLANASFREFAESAELHTSRPTASVDGSFAENNSRGVEDLISLLPPYARGLLTAMLRLDPKQRVTTKDILKNLWIRSLDSCDVGNPFTLQTSLGRYYEDALTRPTLYGFLDLK